MTTKRLIPTLNGDYIWICDTCDHALSGYEPEELGLEEYPADTLEGCRQILLGIDGRLADAWPVSERSDSNLIPKCDCCLKPKEPFQWFTLKLVTTRPTDEEIRDMNTWGAL